MLSGDDKERYEKCCIDEGNRCIYDSCKRMITLAHWDYAEEFQAFQAALLIMGIDPASPSARQEFSTAHILGRIAKSYNSAVACYSFDMNGYPSMDAGRVREQRRTELISVDLDRILQAARKDDDDTELVGFVFSDDADLVHQKFSRAELHRWITDNELPTQYVFMTPGKFKLPPPEKQLGVKELKSLYSIILGMAIDSYGYDREALKSEVPKKISDDLLRHNISVSDDTVRKWLKIAAQVV